MKDAMNILERRNKSAAPILYFLAAFAFAALAFRGRSRDAPCHSNVPRSNSESSWHRHPVLVSVLSVVLGGYGLFYLQTSAENHRALLSKRMQVAEEIVEYRGITDSFIRSASIFFCQVRRGKLSLQELGRREVAIQAAMNDAYQFEARLLARLHLYFPLLPSQDSQRQTPFVRFQKTTKVFHDQVNLIYGQQTYCEAGALDQYFDATLKAENETLNLLAPYIPVQRTKLVRRAEFDAL